MRFGAASARADAVLRHQRQRIRLVGLVFILAFTSLGIRMVDMVADTPDRTVVGTRTENQAADPRRAEIVDRNGHLLATNIQTMSVIADPSKITRVEDTAIALSEVLDEVDAADLLKRLNRKGRFAWVKRQVSPKEQEAVLALGLPGISFEFVERRIYPNRHLVSHVIGFTDIDNQGLAGIEYGQQDRLVGGAALGKGSLNLSLDLRAQQIVRNATLNAVSQFSAIGACSLVLDVASREVVSLVSLPDFDPNNAEQSSIDQRRNRCTGSVFELGSMMKIISTAIALESGDVTLYDEFDASEPLKIGRHRIRDDHGKWRRLSLPEVFAHSSNIGTAQMIRKAGGVDLQKDYMGRLGLLQRGSLEVPEVARPLVPKRWIDIVSATVSYGHGIAMTPLQLTEAIAAVVGDGHYRHATLLAEGSHSIAQDSVVSAKTIEDIRWLMWLAVDRGTGSKADVGGYLVGGKTGTADKIHTEPGKKGYRDDAVIASFVGVFPIEAPRYVVLVSLDEPQGDESTFGYRYGGQTAAPVVAAIIERLGPLMGIAPSRAETRSAMSRRLKVFPAFNGRTHRQEEGFAAVSLAR